MNAKIVEKILERDRIFGKLCLEAENSYKQKNNFSALACLFVLTEQIVKFIVEDQFGDFEKEALKENQKYWPFWKYKKYADDNKLITKEENEHIIFLTECRNNVFHSNLYPVCLEIEGKFWSFSEDDTLQMVYEKYSTKIFKLILRVISS